MDSLTQDSSRPSIPGTSERVAVDGGSLAISQVCPESPVPGSHIPVSDVPENRDAAKLAPMLLLHGWCCNRHSLAPQFRYFGKTRRTVAVDLRGHGDSATTPGPFTVERFARDLLQLCAVLGLDRPVVVGHSMGGAVALEACRLDPGFASAVVLLDGYGAYPDPQRNQIGQFLLQQIESLGFAPVMSQVVDQAFFLDGADQELVTWVKEQLTATDPAIAVPCYRDLLAWDGASAAGACTVPVLNLVSTRPFNLPHRFEAVCPGAVSGQTVGAGHFHGIEVPEQVHLMIDAFLSRVEGIETLMDRTR